MAISGDSEDGVSEVRTTSSFKMSFDEKLSVVYFRTLVSSERHSVSELRVTSSDPNFFDFSCCSPHNCFSSSFID